MINLDLGRPGSDHDFRPHLLETFMNSKNSTIRLRAGFAYATRSGIDEFLDPLRNLPSWNSATKLWLIGVHHGITEPVAINSLAALPNSRVRLATCGLSLLQAITGVRVFHAKIAMVDDEKTHDISTLVVGSANLTGAAIGHRTRNFEAGITLQSPVETKLSRQFDSWWQEAWKLGVGATPKTLSKYIEQRTGFLRRNPDILLDASPHPTDALAEARVLWIEAGAMSTGGSHNAVDFNAELAKFFGPPSSETRRITIKAGNNRWDDRSISPKTTTFKVPLWRLSLPTKAMGGFDYRYRVIRLTKAGEGQHIEFILEVADDGSPEANAWRIETERYGSIGRTGGGHSYGFR